MVVLAIQFAVCVDQSNAVRSSAPAEPRSKIRVCNTPGEQQINRSAEVVRVLDEERALLREEHLETLVDCHLRIVGFHLTEVGIRGDVQHQAIAKDEFRIQPDLASRRPVVKMWIGRIDSVQGAKRVEQTIRDQLDVSAWRNFRHSSRCGGAAETTFNLAGQSRPEIDFVLANDPAIENDSPLLVRQRRKAQAPERDGHPYYEASISQFALGVPQGVEGGIEVQARVRLHNFCPNGIPLNTQRIGLKCVRAASVMKGVKHDLDLVIIENVLSSCATGPDLSGIIEADEDNVEVLAVVSQVGLCAL